MRESRPRAVASRDALLILNDLPNHTELGFWREHDAVQVFRFAAEVLRSADVESHIRGTPLHDLVWRDHDPCAIDFDLIMVAHHSA
jgi:hypothetical protein